MIEEPNVATNCTRSSAVADEPPDAINKLRDNWPIVTSCAINSCMYVYIYN